MSRRVGLAAVTTALLASVALASCRRESTAPDPAAALSTRYFIHGSIVEIAAWGYRVNGTPGTDYKVDQAFFRTTPQTEIRRSDGSPATVADLAVGRTITLWITGIIMESYPVQVVARAIVID